MWRPMVPSPMNPIFMARIRIAVCSSAAPFVNCCLDLPDVRITGDEPCGVHPELGDELAARAFVPIGRVIDAAVTLFERLEGEARKAKPGRLHFGLLSDRQSAGGLARSEEHTSELQSPCNLVCRLLLEKKKNHILST